MANKTQKTTAKKPSTKAATSTKATEEVVADTTQNETAEAPVVFKTPKEIDLHQPITVYNGFQGKLIYKSPRTGEFYEWDKFGDAQELELLELRSAKASRKDFFINNWFMFADSDRWLIDFLGIGQYYKEAISVHDFDDIFKGNPAQVSAIIASMTDGQRQSAEYRARELVNNGEIDSRKMVKALEAAFGVELIER